MINYCKKELRFKKNISLDDINKEIPFNPLSNKEDFLFQFSGQSKEVITLILVKAETFQNLPARQARKEVIKILRTKGWSWPTIWKTFSQIKKIINRR